MFQVMRNQRGALYTRPNILLYNIRLFSNIDGLRRAPDSFYDQRYYSEIILGLKALDKVKRYYVRFRLIPSAGLQETGLLSEDDQRHAW
jgi:hypothetical protein